MLPHLKQNFVPNKQLFCLRIKQSQSYGAQAQESSQQTLCSMDTSYRNAGAREACWRFLLDSTGTFAQVVPQQRGLLAVLASGRIMQFSAWLLVTCQLVLSNTVATARRTTCGRAVSQQQCPLYQCLSARRVELPHHGSLTCAATEQVWACCAG